MLRLRAADLLTRVICKSTKPPVIGGAPARAGQTHACSREWNAMHTCLEERSLSP